MILNYQNTT